MRLFLIAANFAALLVAMFVFREEFRRASGEPLYWISLVAVFGLLSLNLAYIKTTPRTFSFRLAARRFWSGWSAIKDDQQ